MEHTLQELAEKYFKLVEDLKFLEKKVDMKKQEIIFVISQIKEFQKKSSPFRP